MEKARSLRGIFIFIPLRDETTSGSSVLSHAVPVIDMTNSRWQEVDRTGLRRAAVEKFMFHVDYMELENS